LPFSIRTVRAPICDAPAATDNPPAPPPMTQMSVSIVSAILSCLRYLAVAEYYTNVTLASL
jgi:hypothetical protein